MEELDITQTEIYEAKIYQILDKTGLDTFCASKEEMNAIKLFISNCTLTEFEELKDMDFDITDKMIES